MREGEGGNSCCYDISSMTFSQGSVYLSSHTHKQQGQSTLLDISSLVAALSQQAQDTLQIITQTVLK